MVSKNCNSKAFANYKKSCRGYAIPAGIRNNPPYEDDVREDVGCSQFVPICKWCLVSALVWGIGYLVFAMVMMPHKLDIQLRAKTKILNQRQILSPVFSTANYGLSLNYGMKRKVECAFDDEDRRFLDAGGGAPHRCWRMKSSGTLLRVIIGRMTQKSKSKQHPCPCPPRTRAHAHLSTHQARLRGTAFVRPPRRAAGSRRATSSSTTRAPAAPGCRRSP